MMDYKKLFYIFLEPFRIRRGSHLGRNFQLTMRRSLLMVLGTLSIARAAFGPERRTQAVGPLLAFRGEKEDPAHLILDAESESFFQ